MTKFYFIRHGEAEVALMNKGIYQNFGTNMIPLSAKGVLQIKETAKDDRLKNAQIIICSPYGRALHSAAIISKELGIDINVETDLHEWVANRDYNYISDQDTIENLKEFFKNKGKKSNDPKYNYETIEDINRRVEAILDKYKNYAEVIVVCHGLVMECFLKTSNVANGQIEEYII